MNWHLENKKNIPSKIHKPVIQEFRRLSSMASHEFLTSLIPYLKDRERGRGREREREREREESMKEEKKEMKEERRKKKEILLLNIMGNSGIPQHRVRHERMLPEE
jgi:hypothetical protein